MIWERLHLWNFLILQGRAQFYIVVYHFCRTGCPDGEVVDRLLIDLELNRSSEFTGRRTYHGSLGIAQFDLSFRVAGECAVNYYGPECNIFCSGVEGLYTCGSEGNIVCVDSNRNPESNCTECLEEGRDPDNCSSMSLQLVCMTVQLSIIFLRILLQTLLLPLIQTLSLIRTQLPLMQTLPPSLLQMLVPVLW